MKDNTPIFALDIGTRSVIGVILQPLEEGKFHIKEIKMQEHEDRSMLDGQIHDILAVSNTIKKVKLQLEENNGPLRYVSVAAAGRSLKTLTVNFDSSIEAQPLLTKDNIKALELSAVQEAQKKLLDQKDKNDLTNYHCVGYSVINYFLDGQAIGSLIDQRGKIASVEIIATFLPEVVVDSLISSLNRADLEMQALTLEPIAAIHVLIPPTMRKLNIVIVDIGAGTSDIAITAGGSIIAYGMVPYAGDEITEAICQNYLLDFRVAEEVKRKLISNNEVSFTDILGVLHTVPSSDILKQIDKDINNLAVNISEKITELNGKSPQAVILVGGGSQTAYLTEKIAVNLGMPTERVAVRGADAIEYNLNWPENTIKGPDLVTPIGIGISTKENPINYATFLVNNEIVRLFEMKTLTIGDALIAAGIPIKKIYGRPGLAMTVNINGTLKIIPGGQGTMPEILLNNEPANIDTRIKNIDKISIKPGINGKDATLTVAEALDYSPIKPLTVTINNTQHKLQPLVNINNIDVGYSTLIKDRDSILISHVKSIKEALILSGYTTEPYTKIKYNFNVMSIFKIITFVQKKLYRNGQLVTLDDLISDGDVIVFDSFTRPLPTIESLLENITTPSCRISITFNSQKINITPESFKVLMNNQKVELDTIAEPNSTINISWENDAVITFRDVFRYVNLNTSKGLRYSMLLNGESAEFNAIIKNGDELQLIWE
ncbi:MAG: cell division protein FtsA [Vulcanibacillus sp.]